MNHCLAFSAKQFMCTISSHLFPSLICIWSICFCLIISHSLMRHSHCSIAFTPPFLEARWWELFASDYLLEPFMAKLPHHFAFIAKQFMNTCGCSSTSNCVARKCSDKNNSYITLAFTHVKRSETHQCEFITSMIPWRNTVMFEKTVMVFVIFANSFFITCLC